jgi:prepilin-type processing-associated H-X9-DG protein
MADQLPLVPAASAPSGTVIINRRCSLHREGEQRVLAVAGLPVHHYDAQDAVAEAYAMVLLLDGGHATQVEVSRAFGCCDRTLRRHQERYAEGGMAALARRVGWAPGRRRIARPRLHEIRRMKDEGKSNREIARRLGVTEKAIRKQVGPDAMAPQQELSLFPTMSACEPCGSSPEADAAVVEDGAPVIATGTEPGTPPGLDPLDRTWDRLMACAGLLDDAVPVFADAETVPGAGVLFALPALVASGVFGIAGRLYRGIGPAFYGLRTTLLVLLLMALWRIGRPETLKERDPQTLGRVLGLDRAPEVKTLRRKLTRLAGLHQAERLGQELARLRVQHRGRLMGFLYVDGHVRVYHGKRCLPKAHVARMRLSLPATTDYWVNDAAGDPLFVVTAPANAGLVKMLPPLLRQAREIVGERRVTIVFDRGGWSPRLFAQLIAEGFDILTYWKGRCHAVPPALFVRREAVIEGRNVVYHLNDQPVEFLGGKLRLRRVTRLGEDGHQTPIVTSRTDLSDIEVAWRMFERWRQENFFKYMRQEFLLDALCDYRVEPDDPTRTVPNPARRDMDRQIAAARAEVTRLEQEYGAAAINNPERKRPTMRGFKIAHGKIGKALRAARQRQRELEQQRRALPQRVPVRDIRTEAVVKLATERKHLTDLAKMLAFQAESDLLALIGPHYVRADQEGRTLLHELFHADASIRVETDALHVTLAPLSAPHRTLAVQAVCQALNDTATLFPGTSLCLHLAVAPLPSSSMAFPGPRPAPQAAPDPDRPDSSAQG